MVKGFPGRDEVAPGGRRSAAGLLLLLLLLACLQQARAAGILVVASASGGLYSRFIDAFTAGLANGDSPAGAVDISVITLDEHKLTVEDLAARRLVVTVGSRAATDVAAHTPDIPVLHAILPESVYRTLVEPSGACTSRSAIFIDQPIARQAGLAQAMFPDALDYGVLLGPTSGQRQPEIDALEKGSDRHLLVVQADDEADIARATSSLLDRIDLLLAVNDPLVLNRENAKWLLYSAYQHRLPVIGFSRAYVHAGAAGAVYSEPEQMARQAGEMVRHYLASASRCLPAAAFPAYFNVAVNQSVCNSLGGANCNEQTLGAMLQGRKSAQ